MLRQHCLETMSGPSAGTPTCGWVTSLIRAIRRSSPPFTYRARKGASLPSTAQGGDVRSAWTARALTLYRVLRRRPRVAMRGAELPESREPSGRAGVGVLQPMRCGGERRVAGVHAGVPPLDGVCRLQPEHGQGAPRPAKNNARPWAVEEMRWSRPRCDTLEHREPTCAIPGFRFGNPGVAARGLTGSVVLRHLRRTSEATGEGVCPACTPWAQAPHPGQVFRRQPGVQAQEGPAGRGLGAAQRGEPRQRQRDHAGGQLCRLLSAGARACPLSTLTTIPPADGVSPHARRMQRGSWAAVSRVCWRAGRPQTICCSSCRARTSVPSMWVTGTTSSRLFVTRRSHWKRLRRA